MSEIDDYILANRDRYNRKAIDQNLREAGHAEGDIAAAWERTRAQPPARGGGGLVAWLTVVFIAGGLAVALGASIAQNGLFGEGTGRGPLVWLVGLGLYGVVGGAVVWYFARETGRWHAPGWTATVAVLAPFIFGAVSFGSCLALSAVPA